MKEVEVHPKEFTWLINCDSPTDGSADIFLDTSQFNYVSTQDSQSLQWYDCGHHFPASLGAKAI